MRRGYFYVIRKLILIVLQAQCLGLSCVNREDGRSENFIHGCLFLHLALFQNLIHQSIQTPCSCTGPIRRGLFSS
jgi:hypothetical protein